MDHDPQFAWSANPAPTPPQPPQDLATEIRILQHKQKTQTEMWWVLFVMTLALSGGVLFLHLWDMRESRREMADNYNATVKRVDEARNASFAATDDKVRALNSRLDGVLGTLGAIQQQLVWLQARVDGTWAPPIDK